VRRDLLERRVGERVELHLDHRAEAVHRHADGHADDAGLGQRGVEAAVRAELRRQAVGDPEDAAQCADVLAEHQHGVVLAHRVTQCGVERLAHGQRHRPSSSASQPACSRSCGVGSA
jgi:hypothetical protein